MAEEYGLHFRILDLDQDEDLQEFKDKLVHRTARSPEKRLFHLMLAAGCKTVVVEKEYIDMDYRSCYSRLYNLSHHDLPRRCVRLHFFSTALMPNALFKLSAEHSEKYLGFVVLRPVSAFRLGRCILSNTLVKTIVPDGYEEYITCRAEHHANLAGNEIRFIGVPWMQQDTLVSACASAAIWVTCFHMSQLFAPEFRLHSTPEITDLATRYDVGAGRPMPSPGLTTAQMMYALREMGYEPLLYSRATKTNTAADARRNLYYYIESAIPVILSLYFVNRGGHAVTAIGHTLTDSLVGAPLDPTQTPQFRRSSDFVPSFIVQDDATGPFRFIELLTWDEALKEGLITNDVMTAVRAKGAICPLRLDHGIKGLPPTEEVGFLMGFIVPLPSGVTMDGTAAEIRATNFLSELSKTRPLPPGPLVIRSFLESLKSP